MIELPIYFHPEGEIWKPVKGYEWGYEVSNMGRIRSLDRKITKNGFGKQFDIIYKGRILKCPTDSTGYKSVSLSEESNNVKNMIRVHRIVADNFIINPENKKTVNHKNGIKTDNRVENLEWSTYTENNLHAFRTGLNNSSRGSERPIAKITEDDVKEIFRLKKLGHSNVELANKFKVSSGNISNIIHKRAWRHVKV